MAQVLRNRNNQSARGSNHNSVTRAAFDEKKSDKSNGFPSNGIIHELNIRFRHVRSTFGRFICLPLHESMAMSKRRNMISLVLWWIVVVVAFAIISFKIFQLTTFAGGYISDLKRLGYRARPRHVEYSFSLDESAYYTRRLKLDNSPTRHRSKHTINITDAEESAQKHLQNSRKYKRGKPDGYITDKCMQQHDWQIMSFPSCNLLHEVNMQDLESRNVRLINNGYWRDVWSVKNFDNTKQILKTLRYDHDFVERNYDRHRKDALAMDRLSSSPYVIDIYAYCANSGLSEFGADGDINDAIWPRRGTSHLTKLDRLRIAVQVATGIAEMHNVDGEGRASIAHTDITPGQFILIDGIYKLNDFNRCRFMRRQRGTNEPCGYKVGNNPGRFRSPEEYKYQVQTEKVDVYSMGNIFYVLLANEFPFANTKEKEVKKKIVDGERPRLSEAIQNSTDPIDIALITAMKMCHIHDQNERASARQVLNYLNVELDKAIEYHS